MFLIPHRIAHKHVHEVAWKVSHLGMHVQLLADPYHDNVSELDSIAVVEAIAQQDFAAFGNMGKVHESFRVGPPALALIVVYCPHHNSLES